MLRGYLRLVLFTVGLLVGVQVPGFIDQYAKRVSAHYIEVKQNFAGFQTTANQYFNGDIDALVAHHQASPDAVFRGEAKTIGDLFVRVKVLAAEVDAMNAPSISRLIHIVLNPNRDILQETITAYSYTVPLSPEAILYGVSVGLLLSLTIELILAGMMALMWRRRYRAPPAQRPPAPRASRREPSIADHGPR